MSKIVVECISRLYTSSNIDMYMLKDKLNRVIRVRSDELKDAIRLGKLEVYNIILTSDNRLMPKDKQVDARISDRIIYTREHSRKINNYLIESGEEAVPYLAFIADADTYKNIYNVALKLDKHLIFVILNVGGNRAGYVITDLSGIEIIELDYLFKGCKFFESIRWTHAHTSCKSMKGTFEGCKTLTRAPIIPNIVDNMNSTFRNCTRLAYASEIPDGVVSMDGTFENCERLIRAPLIPRGVKSMNSTFAGCTSLVESPRFK